jgi:hypothetical protein
MVLPESHVGQPEFNHDKMIKTHGWRACRGMWHPVACPGRIRRALAAVSAWGLQ